MSVPSENNVEEKLFHTSNIFQNCVPISLESYIEIFILAQYVC